VMGRWRLSVSTWVGLALLTLFLLTALLGPWLAPYSPEDQDLLANFAGPSGSHWLGTDENGRDVLSMLLHGARLALIISGCVVVICATVGVSLGLVAGYYGGKVDELLMRLVDILMAFPGILLNIAIVAAVASPGVGVLIFALTLNGWVGYARVARGQVLSTREREYVQAARCIGASNTRIMFRHILPNIVAPIIVQMTFAFGGVILVEASLSFLGLGVPEPHPSWGRMLSESAAEYMRVAPWLVIFPGIAISLAVFGTNLLGDALRDALDPRQRNG
jgi:peptide/nickel transport system permease protein